MTVPRKTIRLGEKVDRKRSVVKRKVLQKRSVVASKARSVTRASGTRALQGAKPTRRNTMSPNRTTQSTAHKAGKAVGTFLGKAIGNAERIMTKTAETAKGILSPR